MMDFPPSALSIVDPPEAQQAREHACWQITEMLERMSKALLLNGVAPQRDDRTLGLWAVVSTAAELARSTMTLLDAGQRYGAAALLRQLVEVEYLASAFAEDLDEALRWACTLDYWQRRKLFDPKRMRERSGGRFRDAEYWAHCERGGHPHPRGVEFLPAGVVFGHTAAERERAGVQLLWQDFGMHLRSTWGHLRAAVVDTTAGVHLTDERVAFVTEAIAVWDEQANAARRGRRTRGAAADDRDVPPPDAPAPQGPAPQGPAPQGPGQEERRVDGPR